MTSVSPELASPQPTDGLRVLRAVEQRVLWLSVAIVDHANRVRTHPYGLKVGEHTGSRAAPAVWWCALPRRYDNPQSGGVATGRKSSLAGAAELNEGAVWEAIAD